jgi:hypothetical protein
MSRTMVVTGAASGIGKTTAELLRSNGDTVIGVDLAGSDIAIAGLAAPIPATVGVNFFGMVATLEGLRPLLAGSESPRAVGVASMASLHPHDDELVAAMTAGDEPASLARAEILGADPSTGHLIYASTKKAFAQWIRPTPPSAPTSP